MIKGQKHTDLRGTLCYNNDFDASAVKRMYVIENCSTQFIRGWQGHEIESRWFAAVLGSFEITVIAVDDWAHPSPDLPYKKYLLDTAGLNVLHVPSGNITAIQSLETNSKLLVMADYLLGETNDEHRYPPDYFNVFNK